MPLGLPSYTLDSSIYYFISVTVWQTVQNMMLVYTICRSQFYARFYVNAWNILAGAQHFLQDCMCAQRRLSTDCASAHLRSLIWTSQGTLWVAKDPKRLQADSEDWSDWVFAGRVCSLVGNAVLWIICLRTNNSHVRYMATWHIICISERMYTYEVNTLYISLQ